MRRTVLSIFLVWLLVRPALCQRHVPIPLENKSSPLVDIFVSGNGILVAEYEGDHNDLALTSGTSKYLSLSKLLSPSRERYFYVEVLPTYIAGVTYIHYDDGVNPALRADDSALWEENVAAMRVHVHRLSGEREATVDLPRSYCGEFGGGQWVGEHWIWLRHRYGHVSGNFYSVFVNVRTGQKRVVGWTISNAAASDDGGHLAFEYRGVLYVNFRPVFPLYGEPVADLGQKGGWEAYKEKYLVGREKRPHERLGPSDLVVQEYLFAPDGRRMILLSRDAMPPVGVPLTARHLVVLDLEKVHATGDPGRSSQVVVLEQGKPHHLERDDHAHEIRVLDSDGRTVLWRCSSTDPGSP